VGNCPPYLTGNKIIQQKRGDETVVIMVAVRGCVGLPKSGNSTYTAGVPKYVLGFQYHQYSLVPTRRVGTQWWCVAPHTAARCYGIPTQRVGTREAVCAVIRKLLHAIHGMLKHNQPFDNTRFYDIPLHKN
jgi:hypothetical protein